ncbi:transcription-repair coupling factor [Candidatus Poribacteria bacterium]|nr:transcription-repair coupling factor [Candidatus Poribacteria bacterium]
MLNLLNILRESQTYKSLLPALSHDRDQIRVEGLKGISRAYLIATMMQDLPDTTFLVVTQDQDEAEKLLQELQAFNKPIDEGVEDDEGILLFSQWQTFLHGGASPPSIVLADRMLSLERLIHGHRSILVTSIQALMQKLISPQLFLSAAIRFAVGDIIDLDNITETLIHSGYQRLDMVEMKGDFALRGGIMDIFPLAYDIPIRIELFGDEVDSIREFDPISQLSTQRKKDEAWVVPMSEIILSPNVIEYWQKRTQELSEKYKSPKLTNEIKLLTERLEQNSRFDGIEGYLPFLYPDLANLWNYMPQDIIIILDEPNWLQSEAEKLIEQADTFFQKEIELDRPAVPPSEIFSNFDEILKICQKKKTVYSYPSRNVGRNEPVKIDHEDTFTFKMRSFAGLRGNFQVFLQEIENWRVKDYSVMIMSDNEKQAERMREIISERGIEGVNVQIGIISEGFVSDDLQLALVSDDEMFGRHRRRRRRRKFKEGVPISSFVDLKVGDYVVHVTHGIGIYEGIQKLKIGGREQDFLKISYAGTDVLYVPTYQIGMVQKYIGGDETKLKVDKLGGASWSKVKRRAKESVRRLAKELLELYAAREAGKAHAFSPDTTWQKEFEAAFPYEETEDQRTAIEDVKNDMERSRPMDRLVCGDVGYGKTEVAMRAAFKAVMDGKQVAVLVPTTILAQQHLNTFTKRFEAYPIKIGMLSRFRTSKQIKETLEEITQGKIDIIIGTHRLLSKDIKFKDLGLLVIDEEQRFGVMQKEKLKQMRKTVDILTLTATPIPRTLHMSIVGARDLSVINTPPENRLPIETYVMEYNPEIVREAILREMDRGGQVFFVHNRVQSIASIANGLLHLVPEARIAIAHGQMKEHQLEEVMMDFIDYEYDVLVCTTIIESGLDIPNVNTIIINRADALGLAQLYQLRGRVGRDRYKAYGYLFYPEGRSITEDSQKRLRVIEEFTDLGAGFRIALRDLEIRGMGNILGAEQHGHMIAVGYDLYCKLLEEAVKEVKGEEVQEEFESSINLAVDAYLPDDYVSDSSQKVSLYKKIAQISSEEENSSMITELKDRYGNPPPPVNRLLEIADIKRLAQQVGASEIISSGDVVKVSFDTQKTNVNPQKIIHMVENQKNIKLIPPDQLLVDIKGAGQDRQLRTIKNVLRRLI